MVHLGDITKMSGYTIPPVDVVTFGSPCQDLSIVGNKILLSPSRPMPLRSAQNPHNCWVFETIYHSSCVLFDRPLHSKSCIKIVVVCRHIFLRKSVSAPKCQKLDKFSMKRTGTL